MESTVQNTEERDERELPRGLNSYEFVRDFNPSTDLEQYFHYVERLNQDTFKPVLTENGKPDMKDWSWDVVFPDLSKPLEIEIGSGKGNFLADYAEANPEINVLGTEWDPKIAHYAGRRVVRNKLDNAAMLRADVFFFLRDLVPDNSVDAFHMYFPDPWPKKKHHKNRLMLKDGFLNEVLRVLKPGKSIFYWGTDHQEYNEAAQEKFAETPFITVLEKDTAEPTRGIMTNFEKKYREEGRPIYRSVLQFEK